MNSLGILNLTTILGSGIRLSRVPVGNYLSSPEITNLRIMLMDDDLLQPNVLSLK